MQTALTIAGFDPSSGAGVTADLQVFAAHGLFGTSCITALTVQSTLGVAAMHPVSPEIVRTTLDHLHADLSPAVIKIGMLASAETVSVVADYLERYPDIPVVLDPVLGSSSGKGLLTPEGVDMLRARLLRRVNWVTPNLDELGVLTGLAVQNREQMIAAGRRLQEENLQLTVVVTGGHLDRPDDLLLAPDGRAHWFSGERIQTTSTHGTGCAFSSALACNLIRNNGFNSVSKAKLYVTEALRQAPGMGHGKGPLQLLHTLPKS